jgi:SAM-dependent methyltransferase
MNDLRRHAPATLRNREAILAVLRDALPARGLVLEVASGSGEHIVHFAAALPALDWQPSDPDEEARASIDAWVAESGVASIRPAVALDAAARDWSIDQADAILCINMVHISPWAATLGLMSGAGRLLPPGGLLYLYGPYRVGGAMAPSNADFDADLRRRDPAWGVRDLETVAAAAAAEGLELERTVEMPANNLSVLFRAGARHL